MENPRPDPLATTDCNLRGFQWMPLDVVTLIDSELFIDTTGDEFKAALSLWCKSWTQVPAGSLPNKQNSLAELSRAKNWKKVKDAAMRGWVLCSDDRWYHPVIVAKALEALPARKAHADHKTAAAERKALERQDRARLFALLRTHNVIPEFTTTTTKLRELAKPFEGPPTLPVVTRDLSQPVTAKTGQDTTGENRTGQDQRSSVPTGTAGGASAQVAGFVPADPLPPVPRTPEQRISDAAALPALLDDLPRAELDEKILWAGGKALLAEAGVSEAIAGSFIGGLIKNSNNDRRLVFDVMQQACIERPIDPRGWMKAACQMRINGRLGSSNKQTALEASNDAAGEAFLKGGRP